MPTPFAKQINGEVHDIIIPDGYTVLLASQPLKDGDKLYNPIKREFEGPLTIYEASDIRPVNPIVAAQCYLAIRKSAVDNIERCKSAIDSLRVLPDFVADGANLEKRVRTYSADLIANLLHLLERYDIDAKQVFERGYRHFRAERDTTRPLPSEPFTVSVVAGRYISEEQ